MSDVDAFPLQWPLGIKRSTYPTRALFLRELSFARARDKLTRQLGLMRATSIILSSNVSLRLDGIPRSGQAQPQDKGVAVYFQYLKRPMVFACDRWDRVEHNVWAIAKTVDALRGVERWGSGDMLERAFTGFVALPPPSGWRVALGFHREFPATAADVKRRHRELSLKYHPDVQGGNHERMIEINRAYDEAIKELA